MNMNYLGFVSDCSPCFIRGMFGSGIYTLKLVGGEEATISRGREGWFHTDPLPIEQQKPSAWASFGFSYGTRVFAEMVNTRLPYLTRHLVHGNNIVAMSVLRRQQNGEVILTFAKESQQLLRTVIHHPDG